MLCRAGSSLLGAGFDTWCRATIQSRELAESRAATEHATRKAVSMVTLALQRMSHRALGPAMAKWRLHGALLDAERARAAQRQTREEQLRRRVRAHLLMSTLVKVFAAWSGYAADERRMRARARACVDDATMHLLQLRHTRQDAMAGQSSEQPRRQSTVRVRFVSLATYYGLGDGELVLVEELTTQRAQRVDHLSSRSRSVSERSL